MAEFAETAVLIAVMDGDWGEASRLLADFLPGELAEFELLVDLIGTARTNGAARRSVPR